jgi:hypothetical protein
MSADLASDQPRRPMRGTARAASGNGAGGDRSRVVGAHRMRVVVDAEVHTDTDEELLLLAARGDRDALVALHDRLARLVAINVYRVLLDGSQSDAVTEETFAEIFGHPITFDPARDRARAWVLMLAHDRAIGQLHGPAAGAEAPGTPPPPDVDAASASDVGQLR